jgi:hypothetical protein
MKKLHSPDVVSGGPWYGRSACGQKFVNGGLKRAFGPGYPMPKFDPAFFAATPESVSCDRCNRTLRTNAVVRHYAFKRAGA